MLKMLLGSWKFWVVVACIAAVKWLGAEGEYGGQEITGYRPTVSKGSIEIMNEARARHEQERAIEDKRWLEDLERDIKKNQEKFQKR